MFENIKRTGFFLIRITEITILVWSRHTLSVQPILEGGYEVCYVAIKIGGVLGKVRQGDLATFHEHP